jgi:hypothetical protein
MKLAVVIPTDGEAYRLEITSDERKELRILQELVGGFLELVPYEGDACIFCNEEGKLQGLPKNRRAQHVVSPPGDYLVGNIVVLGPEDDDGETTSLSEEEVDALLHDCNRITEQDMARWDKWDDLRARKAAATTEEEQQALLLEEDELRQHGIDEMLKVDLSKPEGWFWLSFADPDLPSGSQFLGVVIVKGGGMQEAIQNAWTMGINPGGEVKAIEIPDEHVPPPEFHNKLLSKVELEEAGLA